jgi:hypothetical protein
VSGCYRADPHNAHSWRDGRGQESEWCSGAGDERECVFCGRSVTPNPNGEGDGDDPHDPTIGIGTPDGRSWAHRGCAADYEHENDRDRSPVR